MSNRALWGLGLLILATGSGFVALGAAGVGPLASARQRFYAACDDVIRDRLKAPSTYRRISATKIKLGRADLDHYMKRETPEKREWQERLDRDEWLRAVRENQEKTFAESKFQEAWTVIEYDAANSFGTAIRSRAICSDYILEGDPIKVDKYWGPRVNNMTKLDWATQGLRDLNGG